VPQATLRPSRSAKIHALVRPTDLTAWLPIPPELSARRSRDLEPIACRGFVSICECSRAKLALQAQTNTTEKRTLALCSRGPQSLVLNKWW